MLMLDTPQLLALALVGAYLVDSMHWLRLGEAVVVTRAGTLRWLSTGGSFELGGRRPFLPNPLTPFWPELRTQWAAAGGAKDPVDVSGEMRERAAGLAATGVCSGVSAAAIAIGAPLALIFRRDDVFLACALVCLLAALTGAAFLFVRRRALGLTWRQWLSLTLVAVICLPCSANLARAAARARRWSLPAADIAQLTLPEAAASRARAELRTALQRAQAYVDQDSTESRALAGQLRQLEQVCAALTTSEEGSASSG